MGGKPVNTSLSGTSSLFSAACFVASLKQPISERPRSTDVIEIAKILKFDLLC